MLPVMLPAADRIALTDLVHRYAAYVDDHLFDSAAELFTDTAELVVPDPPGTLTPCQAHRGRPAIAAAVAAVARVTRTQHAIVGEVYAAAGAAGAARATGRVACIAHHWSRGPDSAATDSVDIAWHLRYDDEYELTDDGWRISRRALTIHAIQTHPVRRLLPRE